MAEPSKFSSTSSRFPQLRPARKGGWGRQPGTPFGGIATSSYPAKAAEPKELGQTRIICVVGITDVNKAASPKKDGWFLSDFYYLHHVFRNVTKPEYQRWLTCLRPRYLIKNYGEYVHGNPQTNDRRVVLDNLMLDSTSDVATVPASILKERFLETVKDWTRDAALLDQQVLVIMLGHGRPMVDDYRIIIGGTSTSQNALPTNSISIREFQQACDPKPRVTLLTTACYSGGWVISPNLPNISMMTPVDHENESISWQVATQGRYCGGRYITGLTNALIRTNLPDMQVEISDEDQVDEGRLGICGPSYAALCEIVHDEVVAITSVYQPTFAARSDEWQRFWQSLSGFRDVDIDARKQELRRIPRSTAPQLDLNLARTAANDEYYTFDQATSVALLRINDYIKSNPGLDEYPSNHELHNEIRDFSTMLFGLEGYPNNNELHNKIRDVPVEQFSSGRLERLISALNYRLFDITALATMYKTLVQIDFPDCGDFDYIAWDNMAKTAKTWPTVHRIYSHAFAEVGIASLFDKPEDCEGHPFYKGQKYLSAMFASAEWSLQHVDAAIVRLKEWKQKNNKYVGSIQVMGISTSQRIRQSLSELSKRSGKRLRSVSPRKSSQRLRESVDNLHTHDHLRRPRHQVARSMHILQYQLPNLSARDGHERSLSK